MIVLNYYNLFDGFVKIRDGEDAFGTSIWSCNFPGFENVNFFPLFES